MARRIWMSLGCVVLLGVVGCAETGEDQPEPTGEAAELTAVPEGKADNYYSNVAAEYEMTGTVDVAMSAADYADEELRARRIAERLTATGLYLTTFVTDKFRGIDRNGDGEISEDEVFFHNEDYGGFHAMVRNYSIETAAVAELGGGVYRVTFTVDVGGPPGLLAAIPGSWEGEERTFEMQQPKGAAFSPDKVPRSDIRRFDPADHDGPLETITFVAKQHPDVGNAYPHFAEFMADGLFDITLYFGHDYNESRSDLSECEEIFDELLAMGFAAPVEAFADLTPDSGPFTRQIKANGAPVDVEVRLFHSNMFSSDRRRQHDLALSEVAARDVFFYPGHAGPYYGLYLDAAGAAKVDYLEFADLLMDSERQQFVIAQGCQTYSQYADMLYANPAKSESNLDVITTVNYSYGRGTRTILRNLLRVDSEGRHQPVDFYTFIRDLNSEWLNNWKDVFYGVMGIDGNPQLHPYVNLAGLGQPCSAASDCGDPDAHVCLAGGAGAAECAAVTLAKQACPSGTHFLHLASRGTIFAGACFKDAVEEPGELIYGVEEGSELAKQILGLVNTADVQTLDAEVRLDRRAAANIVAYRLGLDGEPNTADDRTFATLEELDTVAWVSARAFAKLVNYLQ